MSHFHTTRFYIPVALYAFLALSTLNGCSVSEEDNTDVVHTEQTDNHDGHDHESHNHNHEAHSH